MAKILSMQGTLINRVAIHGDLDNFKLTGRNIILYLLSGWNRVSLGTSLVRWSFMKRNESLKSWPQYAANKSARIQN